MDLTFEIEGNLPNLKEEEIYKLGEEFLSRLAELGCKEARQGFSSAEYEGDKDVLVDVNPISQDTYEIVASGKDVLFIEYGTGVGATHPEGASLGYTPDSWSVDHKREFHDKGYWYYNGTKLTGQPPAMAMYNASKLMKEKSSETMKEVFKW